MSRPVGDAGLALIKRFEGCRLTAYKPVKTEPCWTIGWGHYGPDVQEGQVITREQADELLARDCQSAADAVDDPANCPLTATLNANQRDALISFTFNCGAGCLRTLCKGRSLAQICQAMALYNKAGGQVLAGLARRRAAEQELFNTPVETPERGEEGEPVARYDTVAECPEWARETVQKLVDRKILNGTGRGLDLSCDMVRLLVLLDRAGALGE